MSELLANPDTTTETTPRAGLRSISAFPMARSSALSAEPCAVREESTMTRNEEPGATLRLWTWWHPHFGLAGSNNSSLAEGTPPAKHSTMCYDLFESRGAAITDMVN